MTSDLAKLMETINRLQLVEVPEPIIEVEENKVHPLLQAMQELKEEGIVEAKESIKDQLEKAYLQDGGDISQYFVRSSRVDKLGFSPKQTFARSPDLDHPKYDIDYIGNSVGNPALWFYPLTYYLKSPEVFTKGYPYIWLVKLKPDAWLQPVDKFTKTKQDAPQGKERVGILRKALTPSAIFFKPAFDVVDKFYDYGGQHKRHGEVKGAPVEEEIAYHGSIDDINQFHPFTHFGTEKAAKDRMEYKKIKDGKIYKVDLDIKNPLTIKDFPGIHYDRQYAFELRDKGLISQEEMEAITFIEDKAELRKALLNKLSELGIDGFVYKNKYEDKGNISYVIVDPSQVKVLSVEPAAEAVTEDAENKFVYHITPTKNLSSIEKQGLMPKLGDRSSKIAGEQPGIYTFPDKDAAEDALMNWLGDEFDEDEPLTMLKINISGLEDSITRGADYELIVNTTIEPNRIERLVDQLEEASPDTLEGSFTPDLVESKTWLAKMLAKGLKGKNAGTIYVLGSWYGNMGIFLEQAGVQFDKLVLVEPDEEALMRSKELLDTLNDQGKLILIHQKAEDIVYEKPGVVINTSCNETGPVFLTKLPDNMLCLLQARNNNEDSLFPTEQMEDFVDYFPLETVYYTGEKQLEDPEVNYTRFMKIGRTGKKLDETISTGQGGGSAGVGGGQMVGGPTTYEQEYDMFKSKGPRRITAMTNEALDSSYPYRNSKRNPGNDFYFDTEDGQEYKVQFSSIWGDDVTVGFAARGQGDEHKIGLTGTGNSRKIFGTVIKIVKKYISKTQPEIISFSANNSEPSRVRLYKMLASQADKELPNYNFAEALNDGGFTTFYLTRNDVKIPALTKIKAKAGKALDAVFDESINDEHTLTELFDRPYNARLYNSSKDMLIYEFTTDKGEEYRVYFDTSPDRKIVNVSFFNDARADITNTGDEFRVFATVINLLDQYIKQHEPKTILFSAYADNPSRIKLYKKMGMGVGQKFLGYKLDNAVTSGDEVRFTLSKAGGGNVEPS